MALLADDFRRRLEQVLACPTAPFHEGRVHRVLRETVRASPRLRDRVDPWGNLEVRYGRGRPRLLFACHTDHPALAAGGDGTATIVGGLRPHALVGAGLLDFDGRRVATVGRVLKEDRPGARVRLRGGGRLRRGTPLVLDVPACRISRRWIRARAVDDLVAVAACLALFDRLEARGFDGSVGAVFTRAEEVGFAGALGWTRATRYPRSTTVVNLEMSPRLPHVRPGDGPVLRVGDRLSTFPHELSHELALVAESLEKRSKAGGRAGPAAGRSSGPGSSAGTARRSAAGSAAGSAKRSAADPEAFRWQRALMDGGRCEATVYAFAGFRTGALCLATKDAHNHRPGGGVGPEAVDAGDAENLLRWMTGYVERFGMLDPHRRTERDLDRLWRRHRRALERTAAQGEGGAGEGGAGEGGAGEGGAGSRGAGDARAAGARRRRRPARRRSTGGDAGRSAS